MTKALGKKPPQELCRDHGCDNPCEHHIEKESHYRQALIEAADELEKFMDECSKAGDGVYLPIGFISRLRISAGVE